MALLKPALEASISDTPIAVFDLETTGLSFAQGAEILEVSVVRIEANRPPFLAFDSLIKPQGPVRASRIHKIYKKDILDAPTFDQVAPAIAEALSGAIWVAYNASFDVNFIRHAFREYLEIEIDPVFLCAKSVRGLLGLGKSKKLSETCADFGIDFNEGQHIAVYDTWMTARLMRVWLDRMAYLKLETYGDLTPLGSRVFLKSFSRPLWRPTPTPISEAPIKSRYALDLGEDPHSITDLPPVTDEPPFIYGASPPKKSAPPPKKSAPPPKKSAPSPSESTTRFTLRPYQRDAVHAITRARIGGVKRMVVSLPTGSGKTVIFSHLASIARRRVLVLAHREELLSQAQDKLQRALSGEVKVEIEQGQRRASAGAKVVVASLRSLAEERLKRLIEDEDFGLIIYDECHHAVAEDNQRVLRALGVFDQGFTGTLVGFTATTRRADGLGLDEVFERLVYSRSLMDMIRDRYLVPLRGFRVSTSTSLESLGGRDEFPLEALEERVDIQERNGLVARSIQELARDRRTICFCVTIRHAENLARTLREIGVPAAVIHGALKGRERAQILADFRRGELQVITNVGVLTEGFDDPEVSCIAMARPTRSEGLYIQCVGRGMRLSDGKSDCLILDFVDLSALRLVTLPTLMGMPVEFDLEGRDAVESAEAYHQLMDAHPGFEWEADSISLTELQERARAFDPLSLKLSAEVKAISQNGWVSLGQRGLVLHFSKESGGFNEVVILLTSEPGTRRYQLLFDEVEVGRERLIEAAVEAADWEISQMGYWAVESASRYAVWRIDPAPSGLLEPLKSLPLPRPPKTLEEVFRAMSYFRYVR